MKRTSAAGVVSERSNAATVTVNPSMTGGSGGGGGCNVVNGYVLVTFLALSLAFRRKSF